MSEMITVIKDKANEVVRAVSRGREKSSSPQGGYESLQPGHVAIFAPSDETSAKDDKRVFDWQRWGDTDWLHAYNLLLLGRQVIALGIVAAQVFSRTFQQGMMERQTKYLMACDPTKIGLPGTVVCEASKAFVRSFPIIAIVVGFVVASQLMLGQRLFYLLLRRGTLIDFINMSPWKDPLFVWVVFNFVMAQLHFFFDIIVSYHLDGIVFSPDEVENVIHQVKRDAVFYGAPSLLYLIFLYLSYDIEWLLLPISKFFDEDAAWACKMMSSVVYVNENAASQAAYHQLQRPKLEEVLDMIAVDGLEAGKGAVFAPPLPPMGTYCCAPPSRDRRSEPRAYANDATLQTLTSSIRHTVSNSIVIPESQRRTFALNVSRGWIARLLLDPRLGDRQSTIFRQAWLVYTAVSILLTAGSAVWLILQIIDDAADVANGQLTDLASVVVCAFNAVALLSVMVFFFRDQVPYGFFGSSAS